VSILSSAWNFLTFRDMDRNHSPVRIEYRETMAARPPSWQLNKPIWPKRNIQTYTDQGYSVLALVFRCIGILAQSVAQAPLKVYEDAENGPEPIDTHPLRQLILRPNREGNEARFLGQVMMTMATAGFCVIEKERAAAGRVIALWPINPAYCKPIQRADALPDWEVRVPGYDPVILNSDDCIAITFADRPDLSPTGISPIEVILREVALLNLQTDFLKAFFDSGAMPVYALIPRADAGEMTQAQADVIKEKWRQRYAGMHAAVEPAILAGIEDVRRLSFDFDELAYTDLRDISDNAICQAFGVHPNLAGTRYGLERSTFTNYKEARQSFYEDTVSHFWNRIEDALHRGLMHEFDTRPGRSLRFDISDVAAMREDVLPRWEWAVTALNAGGITTHQFARLCDLEPVGKDVFLRSFATQEVPINGLPMPKPSTIKAVPVDDEDEDELVALPRSTMGGNGWREAVGRLHRAKIGNAGRTAYLKLADQTVPELQAYFDGQKARLVDDMNRGTRDVSALDWNEEDRLLQEILTRLNMVAGEVAFSLAAESLSIPADSLVWTISNPNIARLVQSLAGRVTAINETTRADISRVVTEALTEGVSMPELSDRLRGLYDETYNGRSMTIARTESQVAYNEAAALGYKESGLVREAQLFDNPLHDTDPGSDGWTCAQRNGKIVPLESISRHIAAEHPNGTLAIGPVVSMEA
jgi:HK97 family phage portal protein